MLTIVGWTRYGFANHLALVALIYSLQEVGVDQIMVVEDPLILLHTSLSLQQRMP